MMPRKPLIRTPLYPYHVTARSNNREWFLVDIETCWQIFTEHLKDISLNHDVAIHGFELMSNHFHLVISTLGPEIGFVMNRLMTLVSREINDRSGRINHVFGGRYRGCLIDNAFYYCNVIKYIYRNPVNAGISQEVQDYPFSSLHSWLNLNGTEELPIADHIFSEILPETTCERLSWLNSDFSDPDETAIIQSLKRTTFKARRPVNSHRCSPLGLQLC